VARGIAVDERSLAVWTALGALTFVTLALAMALATPGSTIDLWPMALAFWCTVVLGSGVALVVAWRIGGWARPGQLGTALVALALLVSLLPRFAELLSSVDSLRDVRPLATTVVVLVAVLGALRALRRHDVDTAVRPVHELVTLVCLMVVGVLASATVLLLLGDGVQTAVEWGPAIASGLGSAAILFFGRGAPRAISRGVAAGFLLMGVGSFLRHSSAADLVQAAATAAMWTSAWLFAGIARDRLRLGLAMQDGRSLQTLATLGRYSTEMSRDRERRHDALNALAAIRSAAEVLTSQGRGLDPATRTELTLAARAELARVERMLTATSDAIRRDVVLAEVLRPVLLAHTHRGLVVEAELGAAQVRAVPDIVARIVENLLTNVERHAPGSCAHLSVETGADVVRLRVSDTGPGIPAPRRELVFDSGVTTSPDGQGLGLPSAQRLARDQGGELALVGSGESGCCFVLSLPAAAAARASVASAAASPAVPIQAAAG
jgi:signal transduction histidine kinase